MRIAFENTKRKEYLEYVINNIQDDHIGVCFDSGHWHCFSEDFDISEFKDRIFAVHLHDNDRSDDLHLLPYDGTINWDTLIDKLKDCNYNGDVTLEVCYKHSYLDTDIKKFYKKGFEVANKISRKFE